LVYACASKSPIHGHPLMGDTRYLE
jgi:hypothetical protein